MISSNESNLKCLKNYEKAFFFVCVSVYTDIHLINLNRNVVL